MGTLILTHSPPITTAMQQLVRSPRLPVHVRELQSLLQAERARRERFYQEMSEEQKNEFIEKIPISLVWENTR